MTIRKGLYWLHLACSSIVGVIILIMSGTGFILTFRPQITEWTDPAPRCRPPRAGAPHMTMAALLAAVSEAEQMIPSSVSVRPDPAAPVEITFGPERTIFVNPYTARMVGERPALIRDFFRVAARWHHFLGGSQEGRQTGRVTSRALILVSLALVTTGPFLWWPWRRAGRSVTAGLRIGGADETQIVAIDIGTAKVCVLVAKMSDHGPLEIIARGTAPMKGTRGGNIVNLDHAVEAVGKAVSEAEVMAGTRIESAVVGVAGDHIRSINSRGIVSVPGQAKEITREDIDRVIDSSIARKMPSELELLHVIPREFMIDGQRGIRDPLEMTATRLEVNVHLVAGARMHHQNILNCVSKAGIDVQELVFEQIAAAEAVLTEDERQMGVLLMDIGAGTTGYVVFLEGSVVHTSVLPVGAGHFTSDISVVLRTPREDAEQIKKRHGCVLGSLVTDEEPIAVPSVGGRAPKMLSKHELTGILEPRAAEIAKLIYRDLEKVGLEKEIRSGVVLVGGGAEMEGMVEMVEQVFDQQARKGVPRGFSGRADMVNGPEWAAAAGMLLWDRRRRAKSAKSRRIQRQEQ